MKHINHNDIMKGKPRTSIQKDGCINCTKKKKGMVLGWCNCIRCSNNARIAQSKIDRRNNFQVVFKKNGLYRIDQLYAKTWLGCIRQLKKKYGKKAQFVTITAWGIENEK